MLLKLLTLKDIASVNVTFCTDENNLSLSYCLYLCRIKIKGIVHPQMNITP